MRTIRLFCKNSTAGNKKFKPLKNINIPILVMHGKKDKIIPFHMGKKIYDSAKEPKFFYFSQEDDHMMEFNERMFKNLQSFINQLS